MRSMPELVFLVALAALEACTPLAQPDRGSARVEGGDSGPDLEAALDEHYPTDRVLRYEIEIAPELLAAMQADPLCEGAPPCGDEYVEATFRHGEQVYQRVGVRLKGNSSRWSLSRLQPDDPGYQRFSYKVKFDEFVDGQSLDGIEKLNLNNLFMDPSYMRERLSLDLFRAAGVPASRLAYVNLYLNGAHVGLYVSVQQVDELFLAGWFDDTGGDLFKPEGGDLLYKGDDIADYGPSDAYELKTNEDQADYSRLLHLIDVLNHTPDADFEQAMGEIFDVERFLGWLAVNTALVALDSYAGPFPHNYYLYDDPASGRFAYIPWDLNNSFGGFSCGLSASGLLHMSAAEPFCQGSMGPGPAGMNPGQRPLISRLLEVPGFDQRYREKLRHLLDGDFAPEAMSAAIDRWRALIEEHVAADPNPFLGYAAFEQSLETLSDRMLGLRPFVAERGAYLRAELDGDISAYCGDGACSGEADCEADCAEPTCPPCQVYLGEVGHCVPTCVDACTCPDDLPVALTCDAQRGLCVPAQVEEASCDCAPEQACHPQLGCVPRCQDDGDCPTQAPSCDAASGLCS